MQNLKYHTINIIAVMLFSYSCASSINQVVHYKLSPVSIAAPSAKKFQQFAIRPTRIWEKDYASLKDCGFFKLPGQEGTPDGAPSAAPITEFTLLGTITGSSNIARAMIKKQGDPIAKIYAYYKVNDQINNEIYGYKLVSINDTRVTLEASGQKFDLNLFEKKQVPATNTPATAAMNTNQAHTQGGVVKKTISRSEIMQLISGNIDNATQGLSTRPNQVGNAIDGFQLLQVRPYNVLYKLGARSGDIIKRINNKSLDSTDKLLSVWGNLKNESKLTLDIERGGKLITFDYSVTD